MGIEDVQMTDEVVREFTPGWDEMRKGVVNVGGWTSLTEHH